LGAAGADRIYSRLHFQRLRREWIGQIDTGAPRLGGKIKLDKAALEHWSPDALGKHIG